MIQNIMRVGLLHDELRKCGSIIMECADANQIPAGGALAVDRVGYSDNVTAKLNEHPLIEIIREEIPAVPPVDWQSVIIATGPLTSPNLSDAILKITNEDALAFL